MMIVGLVGGVCLEKLCLVDGVGSRVCGRCVMKKRRGEQKEGFMYLGRQQRLHTGVPSVRHCSSLQ